MNLGKLSCIYCDSSLLIIKRKYDHSYLLKCLKCDRDMMILKDTLFTKEFSDLMQKSLSSWCK